MDTTNLLLALMPLAIGLQTYWIARSLHGLERRLDTMHLDINHLRIDVNGKIDGLRDELHTHELGYQKRNEAVEIRLDRLERS